MKYFLFFALVLTAGFSRAQSASISLRASSPLNYTYSLTLERVAFHETLGVGQAETAYDPVGMFDLSTQQEGIVTFALERPSLLRLLISPKVPAGGAAPQRQISRAELLYIVPGDDLTLTVSPDNTLTFRGKSADYQTFMQEYFLENHYQYLPAFRFNPKQINNDAIVQQSDSLKVLRERSYAAFRNTHPIDSTFDAFVRATTYVQPYLMRRLALERRMRGNSPVRLTPQQQKQLNDSTLANFRLFPDAALLSSDYRNELRHWVAIPASQAFPARKETQYAMPPEAVLQSYEASGRKLTAYPRQLHYLLTYWLNYAATALPSAQVAQDLYRDYARRYPAAPATSYFSALITARAKLDKGMPAPDFTLLDRDGTPVTLASLRGKRLAVVFAFSLNQFEPTLKLLEAQPGNKARFVYISVAPGVGFEVWKERLETRPHALHLYASAEAVEKLKASYAIEPRFPFMVVGEDGRIIDRWIPQQYPREEPLREALAR